MFESQGIYQEISRQARVWEWAGDRIRAWGRGVVTRIALKNAMERERVELLMSARIQRSWR